jgi:hypothetical protein
MVAAAVSFLCAPENISISDERSSMGIYSLGELLQSANDQKAKCYSASSQSKMTFSIETFVVVKCNLIAYYPLFVHVLCGGRPANGFKGSVQGVSSIHAVIHIYLAMLAQEVDGNFNQI